MKKYLLTLVALPLAGICPVILTAQYSAGFYSSVDTRDATVGVSVPITITGGALDTRRAKADSPTASPFNAGFRVLATPQLKLGSHWFVYSALQIYSTPFFYQDAFSPDRHVRVKLIQGFAGYTRSWGKVTLGLKAGKLTTAFGAFPLRYDDAINPLLDQPLIYNYLKLRPDQLPCDERDFSPEPDVFFHCGGADESSYGTQPATLYGLPGAEANLSWQRFDTRVQLIKSSPANPRRIFDGSQHPQVTVGGGYTIMQGFRVGASAFRGPWLDKTVVPFLPQGSRAGSFHASGLGIDLQWARGHWSANGEWQRFVFNYPNFSIGPVSSFGYVDLKRTLGPRWYAAARANYQRNNYPLAMERSAEPYLPNREAYEFAVGFRPNRFQLLKLGYELSRVGGVPSRDNVIGIQFITSIIALTKALK